MSSSEQLLDPFGSFREKHEFQIARYEALQQAWIKRIEIEYQLIGVILLLMGTSLSVGLEYSQWVLLLYPLVAVCLGAIWVDNNIKVREIKDLTWDHDEEKLPYEHTFQLTLFKRWVRCTVLILIVCTEFASVLLALLSPHSNLTEGISLYILLLLDAFALIGSIYLFLIVGPDLRKESSGLKQKDPSQQPTGLGSGQNGASEKTNF